MMRVCQSPGLVKPAARWAPELWTTDPHLVTLATELGVAYD